MPNNEIDIFWNELSMLPVINRVRRIVLLNGEELERH